MGSRTLALFQQLGPWEIGIILVVVLLVFGSRVPDVMRALGRGVTQFKKGLRDVEDEVMKDDSDEKDVKSLPSGADEDKQDDE